MRIYDITPGKNRFCGPAAVSALTGRPVDEVVRVFHARTPRTRVMGTYTSDLVNVLDAYGLRLAQLTRYSKDRPTLVGWLRASRAQRTPGRVFLLDAGNHWVVISGRRAVCGYTKQIVGIREYPKRRIRVREVWEVHENGKPRPRAMPECARQLVEERRARARVSTGLSYWVGKARRAGIEVEKERQYWMVYPPPALADRADWEDPYEGDHMADDAHEVRERVQSYLRELARVQSDAHPVAPEAL